MASKIFSGVLRTIRSVALPAAAMACVVTVSLPTNSFADLASRVSDQKASTAAAASASADAKTYRRQQQQQQQQQLQQQQQQQQIVQDNNSANKQSTLIAGSASQLLTSSICKELHMNVEGTSVTKFDDGELSFEIKNSIRGKNVFIVQSLAASEGRSVNDNFMALILAITATKRAGAASVIAVIPYFSYKHNRRRQAITTPYHSRFLWSNSADLAKMLQVAGVDKVLAVDMQRPGQGHEACFFDTSTPVETISTTNLFVDYLSTKISPDRRLVIISSNTENLKKANKFQKKLSNMFPKLQVDSGVFISNIEKYSSNDRDSELLADVNQADVIIVDEIVDVLDYESSNNIANICRKLKNSGAKRITLCAPHAVLTSESKKLIDLWPIEEVVVTDTIQIPAVCSAKVKQLSIAPLIAKIIQSEASFREGTVGNTFKAQVDLADETFEVE